MGGRRRSAELGPVRPNSRLSGEPYGGIRPQPLRTELADRNPEQYVTVFPNDRFIQDRRQKAHFETVKDQILVCFTKDPSFAYINAVGDHQYHRKNHRANRLRNPGPSLHVNTYITKCKAERMLEGKRYATMENDTKSRILRRSREKAW